MDHITILELPKAGDVITMQYFSNVMEIRANMTGTTMTGRLLVTAEICGCVDPQVKQVEAIYDRFLDFPDVTHSKRSKE